MAFATDRKDKMFTARNLNYLYSRFDQKCYQAFNGMGPLFANSAAGVWQGQYPYGVWYVYRNDPDEGHDILNAEKQCNQTNHNTAADSVFPPAEPVDSFTEVSGVGLKVG